MRASYDGRRSQSPYEQRSLRQPLTSRPETPSQAAQYVPHGQSPSHHYPAQMNGYSNDQIMRPPSSLHPNYHRPATSGGDSGSRYPQVHAGVSSGVPAPLPHLSGYPIQMNQQSSSRHNRDTMGQQFFPTPAQAMEYQQHTDTAGQSRRRSESISSPPNAGYTRPTSRTAAPFPPNVPLSQHYPSQYANAPASSSSQDTLAMTGERFVCVKCGASFGRSHDRKRHYETHHLTSPPVHRCQYCRKEFSRSDSLKRHLDNGCDAMGAN